MKIFEWLDREVELGDPGPKIEHMSTMDLDVNNRLYPNFLERRKARKKARQREKDFIIGHSGGDVY